MDWLFHLCELNNNNNNSHCLFKRWNDWKISDFRSSSTYIFLLSREFTFFWHCQINKCTYADRKKDKVKDPCLLTRANQTSSVTLFSFSFALLHTYRWTFPPANIDHAFIFHIYTLRNQWWDAFHQLSLMKLFNRIKAKEMCLSSHFSSSVCLVYRIYSIWFEASRRRCHSLVWSFIYNTCNQYIVEQCQMHTYIYIYIYASP